VGAVNKTYVLKEAAYWQMDVAHVSPAGGAPRYNVTLSIEAAEIDGPIGMFPRGTERVRVTVEFLDG
jgi:hypothetical protein